MPEKKARPVQTKALKELQLRVEDSGFKVRYHLQNLISRKSGK
jgi:hypothetical protein